MNKSRHTSLSTRRGDEHRRSPARSTPAHLNCCCASVRTLDVYGPLECVRRCQSLPKRRTNLRNQYHLRRNGSGCSESSRYDAANGSNLYGKYRGPVDTLLVAGFDGVSKVRYESKFLNWLKDRCGSSRRFGSVCTGALVLAEAGLLDGRRATTPLELVRRACAGLSACNRGSQPHLCSRWKLLYVSRG